MERKQSNFSKKDASDTLWREFIQRVQSDWELRYCNYGKNINEIETPTKLAMAIHADMVSFFKKENIKMKMINYLTLHGYIQHGGFSKNVKVGTLDTFSRYLYYDHFRDFIDKKANKCSSSTKSRHKGKVGTRRVPVISSIVIVSLMCIFVLFKIRERGYSEEELKIVQVIEEANKLEFDLYKSVPNLKDTSKLVNYFMINGPAYRSIISVLKRAVRRDRKLRISGSTVKLVDIKILYFNDKEASVSTKEKWLILWYDSNTNKDVILYDEFNDQKYFVKKVNGSWKIDMNEYQGRAKLVVHN